MIMDFATMSNERFKTLPGISGYEDTAVTMKSIKEILEEEGASHLLRRREPEEEIQPVEAPKAGPLRQLALQTPPKVPCKKKPVRKAELPAIKQPEDSFSEEESAEKPGILPRLFGRK